MAGEVTTVQLSLCRQMEGEPLTLSPHPSALCLHGLGSPRFPVETGAPLALAWAAAGQKNSTWDSLRNSK